MMKVCREFCSVETREEKNVKRLELLCRLSAESASEGWAFLFCSPFSSEGDTDPKCFKVLEKITRFGQMCEWTLRGGV